MTTLAKTYDHAAVQSAVSQMWDARRTWHTEPDSTKPAYSIVIPPPNVTAPLHLGHALNNTIQDILVRWRRMCGDNAVWIPGTDHAGIATQTVVDKRLTAQGEKALKDYKRLEAEGGNGREQFLAKVQAWKDEYEQVIIGQLKAMGCSCDWDRTAFTMDEDRSAAVREAFFQLFKAGLIYRGKRLVNWDPVTQTALADDEVENEEIDGFFYYLKYPLADGSGTVTVATTRPETMLGDTAVAVNPKDPRAAALAGKSVRLPIVDRVIPIIQDDYVVLGLEHGGDPADTKAKFSSGFLKVTPAHDPNDYVLGTKYNLPQINVMAPDASISLDHGWSALEPEQANNAALKPFVGLSREQAREQIVAWFKSQGLLEKVMGYRHSVGHSYRSHAAIEPYLSDQWYCRVTDERLAKRANEVLAKDDFVTSRDREGAIAAQPRPLSTPVYFLTFSTHGSWLHGDQRGSVDPSRNSVGGEFVDADPYLVEQKQNKLKGNPVSLDEASRFTVQQAILETCAYRGWKLLALHVRTQHLHAVIDASGAVTPEKVMNDLKAYATRALRKGTLVGEEVSVWTRHGSTRYLNDEASVHAAVDYVVDEQGAALIPAPAGDWVAQDAASRQSLPHGRGSLERGLAFFPDRYAKTYETWHNNIRDWCISRQLWWGHRIPVWTSREGISNPTRFFDVLKQVHQDHPDRVLTLTVDRDGEKLRSKDGQEITPFELFICIAPDSEPIEELVESYGFVQDPDVLDTWFSSGLWPMSTLGWPKETPDLAQWNPTSVLCTAREIITLWVSRMVMFNEFFEQRLPFKDVFIHAMIQDGHGQKMSKSLGNGVDPLDIIATHGTDAMRFTLCQMTTHTQDVRLPVDAIDPFTSEAFTPSFVINAAGYTVAAPVQERGGKKFASSYGAISGQADASLPVARNTSSKFDLGRNFCSKLWNASKFVLMQAEGATATDAASSVADRWILSRLGRTLDACDTALREYRFDQYARACYDFVWRDYCDWYIEAAKPAIRDAATKPATANLLASVLDVVLRMLQPITPFITQALWEALEVVSPARGLHGLQARATGEGAVMLASYPEPTSETRGYIDDAIEAEFERLQQVITAVRTLRNEQKVDSRKKLTLHIHAGGDIAGEITRSRQLVELFTLCTIEAIGENVVEPNGCAKTTAAGVSLYILGAVDPATSEKRKSDLAKTIASLKGRLGNAAYVDKAPEALVNQTKQQLADAEAELAKLS